MSELLLFFFLVIKYYLDLRCKHALCNSGVWINATCKLTVLTVSFYNIYIYYKIMWLFIQIKFWNPSPIFIACKIPLNQNDSYISPYLSHKRIKTEINQPWAALYSYQVNITYSKTQYRCFFHFKIYGG